DDLVETLLHRQAHGGGGLAHLGIDPEISDLIVSAEPKVPRALEQSGQRGVCGGDGAALEGVHELGRVEAEYFGTPEVADHPPLMRAGEGMAGIEEEGEVALAGEGRQLLH